MIRKATEKDIDAVAGIYARIHTAEEKGEAVIGWRRGIYPERETAAAALGRGDLFVLEDEGTVVGTAIINRLQVDVYAKGNWQYPAHPEQVMVLHTLVIDPEKSCRGYGRRFVAFYEEYALEKGCPYLRMDTNVRNTVARAMYKGLGYREIGIVPCVFNGLENVQLVLLEKKLG